MIRVYLKAQLADNRFDDEIEITADVLERSLSKIDIKAEGSSFNVGLYKYGELSLSLSNDSGKYSPPGEPQSLFSFRRAGSLIRITWSPFPFQPVCGLAVCGEAVLSDEEEVFQGVLSDESSEEDINKHLAKFKILTRDSVFSREEVPFSSFTGSDTFSTILFKSLNQAQITSLFSVDQNDISLSVDLIPDDLSELDGLSVKELMDKIFKLSPSVLSIKDNKLLIQPRDTIGADTAYTFYGPASIDGIDNIHKISGLKNGLAATRNQWVWGGSKSEDTPSITNYGLRKQSISEKLITDNGKILSILGSWKGVFANPRKNFTVSAPITPAILRVAPLDKCKVDFPTIYRVDEGELLPRFGEAKLGEAKWPISVWTLTIDKFDDFRVLDISYDLNNSLAFFKLEAA